MAWQSMENGEAPSKLGAPQDPKSMFVTGRSRVLTSGQPQEVSRLLPFSVSFKILVRCTVLRGGCWAFGFFVRCPASPALNGRSRRCHLHTYPISQCQKSRMPGYRRVGSPSDQAAEGQPVLPAPQLPSLEAGSQESASSTSKRLVPRQELFAQNMRAAASARGAGIRWRISGSSWQEQREERKLRQQRREPKESREPREVREPRKMTRRRRVRVVDALAAALCEDCAAVLRRAAQRLLRSLGSEDNCKIEGMCRIDCNSAEVILQLPQGCQINLL